MIRKKILKTKLGDIGRDDIPFWNNLFNEFLSGKETYLTLADKLGLDNRTIKSIFDENGWIKNENIYLKTSKGYLDKSKKEDWKEYHEMYMEGKSYQDVAEFLNIERKALCKYFNLFGFAKRTMSESCILGVEKMKNTCQEKLGVDFPTQSQEVKDKVKQTVMNKYDVDNVAKVQEFKDKTVKTNLRKYNVKYPLSNDIIRGKAKDTCRVKYDSDNYMNSDYHKNIVLSKYSKIWLERLGIYGYELLGDFKGEKIALSGKRRLFRKYRIRHKECGMEFDSVLQTMPSCPKCFAKSKVQVELFNYVKSLGFEPILDNRSLIKGIELDIYIPELKIAFEYNGLYWHRDDARSIDYHRNKTQLCLEKGIKLYHIWSSDPTDVVKSKINQILKKTENKFLAKKLELSLVSESVRREFMGKNHLHGDASCSFSYGLFDSGELIQCISFKVCGNVMENTRFATKINSKVDFGFSRLLKHSIAYIKENYKEVNKIVTFAYRDWTPDYKDSVYFKSGFKFIKDSGPMMFYTDGRVLYSRQRFMKYKLKELFPETYDESLTEKQILALNGIYSIHNSGNLKFQYFI